MHDLITTSALSILVVSFGVGIAVGLTGMGGGALMTPALLFLGVDPTAAVANDLVASSISRSVGAGVHWRKGAPNLRLAGFLIAGSVPFAFAGAFIVKAVGASDRQESFVKLALGVAVMLAAGTYALRAYLQLRESTSGREARSEEFRIRPVPTVMVGAIGGLLVGITSVGAGSLMMVTLLLMYPALKAVKLVGTDLVQAVPLVLSAAISHVVVSGVQWSVLLPLVIGSTPGTYVGSRIAHLVSQSVVKRGIVIVLSLTGLTLLKVPPEWVGLIGAGLLILGPVAWGGVRRSLGLPAFENIGNGATNGGMD
ncbi:MAG: sulfite exporter TauE/SafE family protein [Nocardioidaceae bacterium]